VGAGLRPLLCWPPRASLPVLGLRPLRMRRRAAAAACLHEAARPTALRDGSEERSSERHGERARCANGWSSAECGALQPSIAPSVADDGRRCHVLGGRGLHDDDARRMLRLLWLELARNEQSMARMARRNPVSEDPMRALRQSEMPLLRGPGELSRRVRPRVVQPRFSSLKGETKSELGRCRFDLQCDEDHFVGSGRTLEPPCSPPRNESSTSLPSSPPHRRPTSSRASSEKSVSSSRRTSRGAQSHSCHAGSSTD